MERSKQQFGPFQVVRTIGRGGMGEVFIARTPWTDHPVAAVKRLRPDVARVPTFAERFRHESELAVRLDHANVVRTLDVGSVSGQLYVASELVLGKDTGLIADRLRERNQGGPAAVAIRLMLDVLAGLAYVHQAVDLDGTPLALVHRDITPGNVLVSYEGVAKLADFGLAKSLLTEKAHLTQHGEILGTPHYLAPEIIQGDRASRASDLYGLGAVIYRFLTGVAPHYGTTAEVLMKVVSEEPRSLSELRPDLAPWLVTFVHRLLIKQPLERPSDARELLLQLGVEAEAAGLLVPRSAVGRWLGHLFEAEKVDELEECSRLCAMTADDLQAPSEGTVVIAARARSGDLLRAPATDVSEPVGNDDALSAGTDLSMALNALHDNTDARPVVASSSGLGSVVPSDVTDSAQVVSVIELGALDGMPTRAMTMQPHRLAFDEDSGTHEMLPRIEFNPQDAPVLDLARAEGAPGKSTALPGFIEPGRPLTYAPGDTTPDPDGAPIGRRPRSPGSVVVQPMTPRPNGDAHPGGDRRRGGVGLAGHGMPSPRGGHGMPSLRGGHGMPSLRGGQGMPSPRAGQGMPLPRGGQGMPSPRGGQGMPSPRAGQGDPGPLRSYVKRPSLPGGHLLLLAAMLSVAVLLGVVVGALVVSYRSPGVPVVAPAGPLQEQLFRVQTRLVGRAERGEAVPADVWSKLTRAHEALNAGNEAEAAALLDELESRP